jgi:NAD(P)-dependent dehydrogenase (short-subunit alcohol dehydrogenase family)
MGVVSLTQSGARDLAKHNITVTGFAPGVVATEMWEQVDQDLMEIGAAERPGQAMEDFPPRSSRAVSQSRRHHRDDDVSGFEGQRLHDRPDRDDRRRHDAGLTKVRAKAASVCQRCGHFRMGEGTMAHTDEIEHRRVSWPGRAS